MHSQRYGNVLPDELPEEPAQWALRRRAPEWPLRGEAGDAVRLGGRLGGGAAHGRGHEHPRPAAAGRPSPLGALILAARGPGEGGAGAPARPWLNAAISTCCTIPELLCRRCPAIPRAAGWSACCATANSP